MPVMEGTERAAGGGVRTPGISTPFSARIGVTAGTGWGQDSWVLFVCLVPPTPHRVPGRVSLPAPTLGAGLRRCLRVPAEGAAWQRLELAPAKGHWWPWPGTGAGEATLSLRRPGSW